MFEHFLDWYFSLPTEYPIFFLTCIPAIFSFFMRRALEKNREIKKSFFVFIFLGGLTWFSLLLITSKREFSAYYGNVQRVEFIQILKDKIWLVDKIADNSGDSQKYIFRLQILSFVDGKKLDRRIIGNNFQKVYFDAGNLYLVKFSQDKIIEYCHVISSIDLKTTILDHQFFENFPQISNGVQSLEFVVEDIFKITDKKGYLFFYDLSEKRILEKSNVIPLNRQKHPSITETQILDENGNIIYEFIGERRKHLVQKIGDKINTTELEYIDPKFLNYNPTDKSILILHFEDTENQKFYLSNIGSDYKEKWMLSGNALTKSTFEMKTQNVFFKSENEKLLFNLGSNFYFINTNSGKLIWKNKL
jgi:hypothetical protein